MIFAWWFKEAVYLTHCLTVFVCECICISNEPWRSISIKYFLKLLQCTGKQKKTPVVKAFDSGCVGRIYYHSTCQLVLCRQTDH